MVASGGGTRFADDASAVPMLTQLDLVMIVSGPSSHRAFALPSHHAQRAVLLRPLRMRWGDRCVVPETQDRQNGR